MTLRAKLLLALSPLVAAFMIVGVGAIIALFGIARYTPQSYRIVARWQQLADQLQELHHSAIVSYTEKKYKIAAVEKLQAIEDLTQRIEKLSTEYNFLTQSKNLQSAWHNYRQQWENSENLVNLEKAMYTVRKIIANSIVEHQRNSYNQVIQISALARKYRSYLVWIGISLFSITTLISILLIGKLLKPWQTIQQAVQKLAKGDFNARAVVHGRDEIAQLAAQFNQLATNLQEYQRSSLGDLLQAQQASQAAIDSLPDPVIVLGLSGQIVNTNQSAESITEASLSHISGLPLALQSSVQKIYQHVLSGKGSYQPGGLEEAVLFRSNGAEIYFLPRATPVYNDQGVVNGATILLQDVTRLYRFDQLKHNLVMTLTKELHDPLLSLRLALHICLEENIGVWSNKQTELLLSARSDSERIQSVLEELLDLSHIETGHAQLNLEPYSAQQLTLQVVQELQENEEDSSVQLQILTETEKVLVDPPKMKAAFSVLLNYLLKKDLAVTIEVESQPPEHPTQVYFTLNAPTYHIPAEHIQGLLERPESSDQQQEGDEFNLFLVRQMVRAHSGEIGVLSPPQGGIKLWFALPIAKEIA